VKALIETSEDALVYTLMRSGVIVVIDEFVDETMQVAYIRRLRMAHYSPVSDSSDGSVNLVGYLCHPSRIWQTKLPYNSQSTSS
jgi:hypothetical protein